MQSRQFIPLAVVIAAFAAPVHAAESPSKAPPAAVQPLLTKTLADVAGKEVMMLAVEYPPGGASQPHRHDAHTFVYVLEGSIVMAVSGGKEMTLTAGETFYESPTDVHSVSRNASTTQPAKFLVFFLKNAGAPATTPVDAASASAR